MSAPSTDQEVLYGIDDKPPIAETTVFGLQHYLTMFGSTVAVPLMLGWSIGNHRPC